jgi:hypothetical protein
MAEKYAGIRSNNNINAADVEAALDTKVSKTGDVPETIEGTKTFTTSPLVPSKSTAAGSNSTVIATEAQVHAAAVGAAIELAETNGEIMAQLSSIIVSVPLQIAEAEVTNTSYTDSALESKVSKDGNEPETITGTKTFGTAPVVPSKNAAVTSTNTTKFATEAQVYAASLWQ